MSDMINFDNKSFRVLLVDDSSTMRMVIKHYLTAVGFTNFSEAEHGFEAMEILEQDSSFDIIISDWNMPGMTGFELLKRVKKDERLKSILFLMVTAEQEKEKIIDAIQAGLNGYLIKPFSPNDIRQKVINMLDAAR